MFSRTGVLLPCLLLHAGINNWPRILPSGSLYPLLFSAFLLALVFSDRMWRARAVHEGSNALPDPG